MKKLSEYPIHTNWILKNRWIRTINTGLTRTWFINELLGINFTWKPWQKSGFSWVYRDLLFSTTIPKIQFLYLFIYFALIFRESKFSTSITKYIGTVWTFSFCWHYLQYRLVHTATYSCTSHNVLNLHLNWTAVPAKLLVINQFKIKNYFFFSSWFFFHEHSRIIGLQGKGEDIYLTPQYHFHPLHGDVDISPICRELTSAHSQEPDSNRELLISKRKSLTTKLRTLKN